MTRSTDISAALAIGFATCALVGTLPVSPRGVVAGRALTANSRSAAPDARAASRPSRRRAMAYVDSQGPIGRRLLDYIWLRESDCGQDPRCLPGRVGRFGERGEYQVTPIFCRDYRRLTGQTLDPYNNSQCRYAIVVWMSYYAPRVGAESMNDLYELYRRGPTGYRRWQKRR